MASAKNTCIECTLDSCAPYYVDGVIVEVFVQSESYRLAVDGSGMRHNIGQWQCRSMAEFELQAMLCGCLSGLTDKEEAAIKEAAESLMAKKVDELEKKVRDLEDEIVTLTDKLVQSNNELAGMKIIARRAYVNSYHITGDARNDHNAAWEKARNVLESLAYDKLVPISEKFASTGIAST